MRDTDKNQLKKPSRKERLKQNTIIAVPLIGFGFFLYLLVNLLNVGIKLLPFDPLIVETLSVGAVFITSLASGAVMLVLVQRQLYPRRKRIRKPEDDLE